MCSCPPCTTPHGDLAHNPGMCPDWESNQGPFASQASAQSTEPHQPGPNSGFLKGIVKACVRVKTSKFIVIKWNTNVHYQHSIFQMILFLWTSIRKLDHVCYYLRFRPGFCDKKTSKQNTVGDGNFIRTSFSCIAWLGMGVRGDKRPLIMNSDSF